MRRLAWVAVSSVLFACGGSPAPRAPGPVAAPPPSARATSAAPVSAPSELRFPQAKEMSELGQELAAAHVSGTIALYDSQTGVLACSDLRKCREAVTPASTFKIAHSMIALELGIVEGPDSVLPWSGKTYSNQNWNQDLSFRDAFRYSCLPCFQAIARKVGEGSERAWVEKLGYGNHDVSGGVDRFWIWGGLRISPLEQIDFLRRFEQNRLPISEATADFVRDIMTLDVTERYVLRGKTGSTSPPDEPRELFWFVGWVEADARRVFFATLLDGHASGVEPAEVRRPLTERILRARGAM